MQADGSVKELRMRQGIGPSRTEKKISKKEAEIERDRLLAKLNNPTPPRAAAGKRAEKTGASAPMPGRKEAPPGLADAEPATRVAQ